jgi:MFS family permease
MLLIRLSLYVIAFVVTASALVVVLAGVDVLRDESGPVAEFVFLGVILAGLAAGGPYAGYLLVRTGRRLSRGKPTRLRDEVQAFVLWLIASTIAAATAPLSDDSFGLRATMVVVMLIVGVIGAAHALERERERERTLDACSRAARRPDHG